MQDLYGHLISYLRVAITDRCNERCTYCRPQELQEWLPRAEILSYEETLRLIRIAAELGVSKAQLALAWVLRHADGVIAIPKAGTAEHVREDRAALDLHLTPAHLKTLDQAFPPPTRPVPLDVL